MDVCYIVRHVHDQGFRFHVVHWDGVVKRDPVIVVERWKVEGGIVFMFGVRHGTHFLLC